LRDDLNSVWQESLKLYRAYVSCFNVDPQFACRFNMPKARNAGEFAIKFLVASFNKEAGSGEFFIEFDEKVWYNNLLKQFEDLGAGDVYIATFKHNDGNDSAASALLRVWELGERNGITYTRGVCPEALMAKALKKQAESKYKTHETELDEKTQAAIRLSMQNMEGKMDQFGDQITLVETGVCKTIPYYQDEIEKLRAALAVKTLDCDRQEKRVADMTRIRNELRDANYCIVDLQQENQRLKRENKLLEALETAKWIITDERAMKRARSYSDV
jgi:hypothetical protein